MKNDIKTSVKLFDKFRRVKQKNIFLEGFSKMKWKRPL
jgi:hypothetical protein